MHCGVAQLLDDPGFGDDRIADGFPESRFMDAGRERGLEWVA
jgi:hypothetical protein